jgi:hypothetical protein
MLHQELEPNTGSSARVEPLPFATVPAPPSRVVACGRFAAGMAVCLAAAYLLAGLILALTVGSVG